MRNKSALMKQGQLVLLSGFSKQEVDNLKIKSHVTSVSPTKHRNIPVPPPTDIPTPPPIAIGV